MSKDIKRSDKLMNLIESKPHFIIRWGTTIIFLLFVLMIVAGYFIIKNYIFDLGSISNSGNFTRA